MSQDLFGLHSGDTGENEKKGTWTGAGNQSAASDAGFAPSAGQFQSGTNTQAQGAQHDLMAQLSQQAAGKGPSIATQQLQQAGDQNIRQQAALAAGNRGNPSAAYNAAQNAGANQQAMSGQAAMARTQEELNAQQAAAGLAGQMQQQGYQGANMQNQFGLDNARMGQQGAESYGQLMQQQQMAQNQQVAALQQQREKEQNDATNQEFGGLMSAGSNAASFLATSDKNLKKNVRPGAHSLHDFLDALDSHEYEYKDDKQPGTAPGTHVSVMAQELEKTPTGQVAVVEAPHGKMVDYKKILPAMLAAVADTHKRLKKVEKSNG